MKLKILTKIKFLFGMIALLVTLNILIINTFKKQEKADSVIVDIAGRNRMLSQKIVLLAEIYIKDTTVEAELQKTIEMHHFSFLALRDGGMAPAMNSDTPMPKAHKDAMPTIEKVQTNWEKYRENAENIIKLKNNPAEQNEALLYLEANRNNMLKINNELVKVFVEINEKKQSRLNLILVLLLFLDLGGLVFGYLIIKSNIISPIKKISKLAQQISEGELNSNCSINRNDEIGELSNAVNSISNNYKNLALQISKTSDMLFREAKDIEKAANQLTQQADYQNLATSEITNSIQQILSTIDQNTKKSSDKMQAGNKVLLQTVQLVSEINQKIEIISEIANKTDILSVNAAIEASRAGEVGRGFSVVAHEIRVLSDKTKAVSKEVEKMTDTGNQISNQAKNNLSKLLPIITKNSQIIRDIINQGDKDSGNGIKNSLDNLSNITTKNSSLASEMEVSANEIIMQAEQLQKQLEILKTS